MTPHTQIDTSRSLVAKLAVN